MHLGAQCLAAAAALLFARPCLGYPQLVDKIKARQIDAGSLRSSYDYIIVGGGQSGLVIANRLSEDSSKTVLVVEYGYIDTNPAQLEPSSATNYLSRNLFNVTSVPQTAIGGRRISVYAASVVGGGSTVNGMLFDRGSAEDYNNWAALGNPGWDFPGLLPYFRKSTTFGTPDPDIVRQYNITWDPNAYGNGPIEATFPSWQWPAISIQWQAWNEVGVPKMVDGETGNAFNAYWTPNNVDSQSRRSYAKNRYFDPVASRQNLHLLTGYRVNDIQFSSSKRAESVRIQQRGTPNGGSTTTIRANQEIVLCAGWLNTPLVLQRSGIGPQDLLSRAGVPLVVDLPGVGSNLQDHPAGRISFEYTRDIQPNQASLRNNQTFSAWAQQQWQQYRKGPLSMLVGNALATLPLPTMLSTYQSLVSRLNSQNAAQYLPSTYGPANIRGFEAQRRVLAASYASRTNGVVEIPFNGAGATSLVLEKPLSRGTVLMNPSDRLGDPTVDFGTSINPLDNEVYIASIRFYRQWMQAPSMQQLGPQEQSPGASLTSDQQLINYATQGLTSTTAHSCGTAAMMPQDQGGVVSPQLLVYGVTGLSVGDISLIPLIPATHTCATVYAIAEKAADLIKARAAGNSGTSTTTTTTTSSTRTTTSSSRTTTTTTTRTTTTTTTTRTTTTTTTSSSASVAQPKWSQCGGIGWTGSTICTSGTTCQVLNPYYSQCL
ncbi:hypothetical protein DRE_04305 [Drechslerella stenobrocha 248]|uniref:CBM1 domain-containing protein n=1 Tax=Drechslerella stenobrocha 248 TaxID=1043628 RepID=W7I1G6_9PEZI|nr:hypothetical protein DRE_04305 [Drechslerella stenobrocha 248]